MLSNPTVINRQSVCYILLLFYKYLKKAVIVARISPLEDSYTPASFIKRFYKMSQDPGT